MHFSYAEKVPNARKGEIIREQLRQKVDSSLFTYIHGNRSQMPCLQLHLPGCLQGRMFLGE